MKKVKEVDTTTLVVCVGCGGIFYHGLPRMATFCNRRDKVRIVLIDSDKIEEKNAARQWGVGKGKTKVGVASEALRKMVDVVITMVPERVDTPKNFVDQARTDGMLWARMRRGKTLKDYWPMIKRIVVVGTPDNHLCRVHVHNGCSELAKMTGKEVIEITSGNGLDYGYAFGAVHTFNGGGKKVAKAIGGKAPKKPVGMLVVEGDWTLLHKDILREAEMEAQALAEPASCGELVEATPGQTMATNQLTSMCVWDLAEMMITGNKVGEVYWTDEPDFKNKKKRIHVVRANLKDRV